MKHSNPIANRLANPTARLAVTTILSVLVASVGAGCNYNELKNPSLAAGAGSNAPGRSGNGTADPQSPSVDFQTVKAAVFEQNCVKCHGPTLAKAGVRVDDYALALANVAAIRAQITAGTMPPPAPRGSVLTPEQVNLVVAWIDSGAPETSDAVNPTLPPTPPAGPPSTPIPGPSAETPDFAFVSQTVFEPHCVKCHSNETAKGGVNLTVYTNAVRHASKIKEAIETDDMPRRAPPLTPDLKAIVYAWIANGTPEIVK